MQNITYTCNFCGGGVTRDTGIGVEFKPVVFQGSKERLEISQFEKVARHLCLNCLTDITRISNRYNSNKSDSK